MTIFHVQYPHRRNHDGSFDSICPTCFATIGHTKSERELADAEQNHSCERTFLDELCADGSIRNWVRQSSVK